MTEWLTDARRTNPSLLNVAAALTDASPDRRILVAAAAAFPNS
jgi:hypothetical protein